MGEPAGEEPEGDDDFEAEALDSREHIHLIWAAWSGKQCLVHGVTSERKELLEGRWCLLIGPEGACFVPDGLGQSPLASEICEVEAFKDASGRIYIVKGPETKWLDSELTVHTHMALNIDLQGVPFATQVKRFKISIGGAFCMWGFRMTRETFQHSDFGP